VSFFILLLISSPSQFSLPMAIMLLFLDQYVFQSTQTQSFEFFLQISFQQAAAQERRLPGTIYLGGRRKHL
jgi:hypothetical protein